MVWYALEEGVRGVRVPAKISVVLCMIGNPVVKSKESIINRYLVAKEDNNFLSSAEREVRLRDKTLLIKLLSS
jgi:hypothetical protein